MLCHGEESRNISWRSAIVLVSTNKHWTNELDKRQHTILFKFEFSPYWLLWFGSNSNIFFKLIELF